MYLRRDHAEFDIPTLQRFIHDHPLGILTTAIKSPDYPLIQSSHIPFILDVPEDLSATSPGVLRAHMAKQNPQAKVLMAALAAKQAEQQTNTALELDDEVLVLFTAMDHYVTPKFYVQTKPETGKVVPTWNYAAVQAYGKIRVFCDSKAEETSTFLQRQIEDLSQHAETAIMHFDKPWKVSDAPVPYIELLKKNIIGIEIRIERLEGKFKMSQEMGVGDRKGVVEGFEKLGTDIGKEMAKCIKERWEIKDGLG